MSYTLHVRNTNYVAWKLQIVAAYGDVKLDVVEHKNPKDFASLGLTGKAPVLETPQGNVTGSNTIARFLAGLRPETGLTGNSFFQRIQVEEFVDMVNNDLEPARLVWLLPVLKQMDFSQRTYFQAKKDVTNVLKTLDEHLSRNTYLVGQAVTLADITVATALLDLYTTVIGPKLRDNNKNVLRWFNTIVNQSVVAGVIGPVTFAEVEKKAPKPVKKQPQQKKAKKAPVQQAPKPKKKPKDPRLLLPPSNLNLEAEKKRYFFAKPYGANFFPDFWKNFDAEGYSLWISDYKYDSDNKEFWLTQNAMGGFIQRASPINKFGFGLMFIYGVDEQTAPFHITGAWIFRGQVVHPEILGGDGEWYDWRKLDSTNSDDRQTLENYFLKDDEFKGQKILDKRFYK
jgi:elongation factor 1-gamma